VGLKYSQSLSGPVTIITVWCFSIDGPPLAAPTAAGVLIVDWFYDAAVSGADPIEARPGFTALLARIAANGARTIIVETANRFARDLMVQEVGFAMLRDLGITLIAADSPASVS
jgi:DNA invertase Pin-like site-specific DNA recombinase